MLLEQGQQKSFSVLKDNGASGPVADTGRRDGLDCHDFVSENALSRDCLEIDMG